MTDTEKTHDKKTELTRIVDFATSVGTYLLSSGAHCGRINRNINRIVKAWGVNVEIYFSFTGILITGYYKDNPEYKITTYKQSPSYNVNFTAINEVSQLSWLVDSKKINISQASDLFQKIKNIPYYSTKITLLGIGLSCACLCLVAGGDWRDALFSFIAAICGMIVRLYTQKKGYNTMISTILAAFVTTLITSLDMINILEPFWGAATAPDRALATSVLYLVPGVPLTNCIIDLIEGYIPTAIFRGTFGAFILLCIAVGMSLSILMFGINNF